MIFIVLIKPIYVTVCTSITLNALFLSSYVILLKPIQQDDIVIFILNEGLSLKICKNWQEKNSNEIMS